MKIVERGVATHNAKGYVIFAAVLSAFMVLAFTSHSIYFVALIAFSLGIILSAVFLLISLFLGENLFKLIWFNFLRARR